MEKEFEQTMVWVLERARRTTDSGDIMRLTQAAVNLQNARYTNISVEQELFKNSQCSTQRESEK